MNGYTSKGDQYDPKLFASLLKGTAPNPLMPNGLCYLFLWTGTCLMESVSGLFLLLSYIVEIPVLNANSVDLSDAALCSI